MQIVLTIGAVAAVLYLCIALALYVIQRRLIYYPDTEYFKPADAKLEGVREVKLDAPDGVRLISWWAPAPTGQPTILYFHGNAGGLMDRAERIRLFVNAGFGIVMPSYRGYSGSTGKPSEKALIGDAALAYDHLRSQGLNPRDIVLYGESLGSGVAVQLATKREVAAVILDAPYTSLPDIGKRIYPYIPVETFMTDRFDSKRHIAGVTAPILIMHGKKDVTTPVELGAALYEVAPKPKELVVLEEAGHTNIFQFGAMAILRRFIDTHRRSPDAAMSDGHKAEFLSR